MGGNQFLGVHPSLYPSCHVLTEYCENVENQVHEIIAMARPTPKYTADTPFEDLPLPPADWSCCKRYDSKWFEKIGGPGMVYLRDLRESFMEW